MEQRYDHKSVERKWREVWEQAPPRRETGDKFYCLDMFPYPSANGLHVGHWRGYVLSDVISRHALLNGKRVLHPMGWDAFGLPAENYAIKTGSHPEPTTRECIANFKKQMQDISAVFDWDRELATTDPDYYKWTQWIFLKMFERGLAYEKEMPLNWCPSCRAVLANEEAAGGVCDRCGHPVTKKNLRQWMLKITAYAERLLADLDGLDWPDKVKKMQADWIGKSYGAEVDFPVEGAGKTIRVYTTRPDTLFGATFIVLSPEHALVGEITACEHKAAVEAYVKAAGAKSSVDRMAAKDKTGVFTGAYGINPVNGAKTPVWVSDYVLADYGTGAIMCVPAHDDRDFEFATKFSLPIIQVIQKQSGEPWDGQSAYTDDGALINSGEFTGLTSAESRESVSKWLEERGAGKATVNYKLRDWVFSRQRYWGEPIPLIHCGHCGVVPVPEAELPVKLPYVERYQPTDTGESPLALIDEWVNVPCPICGKPAKRETNTMPQWAGSSWYFLRYADSKNPDALIGEAAAEWLPVDYYVGGIEHAVLHLLYARFYTKALYDCGVVSFTEPFKKLFNQGMLNLRGKKMSKSAGNVVSPDDIVEQYGRDALRLYMLFVAPPELDCEWEDSGIEGVYRFMTRLWRLFAENKPTGASKESEYARNKLITDISARIESLSMNTAVSAFMEYTNALSAITKSQGGADKKAFETLAVLLAPFAPHMAEEMWQGLGHATSVFDEPWPKADASKLKRDKATVVAQINGKVRAQIEVSADAPKDDVVAAAKAALGDRLAGEIVKEVYVPGRIVNFVVKG